MQGYYVFYVDIYSTNNLSDFVALLGAEIADRLKTKGKKALQRFWQILHLRPLPAAMVGKKKISCLA